MAVVATLSPAAVLVWVAMLLLTDAQLLRHSRSPRREILSYRSYKDITILPYNIPEQGRFASFNFTVNEEKIYAGVNQCTPRNVTVVLKPGSFPVINPDGADFPDDYWNIRVPQYESEFLTDSKYYLFNISNPTPGDWFAVIFLSYTDPNDDKILQQGLSSSCIATVESSVDIILTDAVTTLVEEQPVTVKVEAKDGKEIFENYKFFVPDNIWMVHINLSVEYCKGSCPPLNIAANSYSFPNIEIPGTNSSLQAHCSAEQIVRGDGCLLNFMPSEDAWHYLTVASVPSKKSRKNNHDISYIIEITLEEDNSPFVFLNTNYNNNDTSELISIEDENSRSECNHCWPRVPLMRQYYPAFFMYNYIRVPNENEKSTSSVNLTTKSPTVMKIDLYPIKDIGGTLTFELRLDRDQLLDNVTTSSYNVSVVSCLSYSSRSEPQFPDMCVSNSGVVTPVSVLVNSTSPSSYTGKIHVPYPEPGRWYVTLRPFCFVESNGNSTTTTTTTTTTIGNTSYTELECSELNVTTVSFIVDSDSCGPDSCGYYGNCLNYMSGGVIFSTCVCEHGYSGWACTDESRVTPLWQLLIAALLLTLSNLLFLPAVIIAVRRRLWTEAFVYSCTMFFSTFYHACEAGEDVYSYCIMRLGVLQFCDFYTAILAMWVTVIAMADLMPSARSLAHMVGAVGIALGTEYDRTSLAVFLVPTLIGLAILCFQWGSRCWSQKSCYPKRKYWIYFFPPGILLVLLGMSCYSFLQTRNNYKYVHSAWHAIMAIAIVFLLPMKKYSVIQTDESDYSMSSSTRPFWTTKRFWLCNICRRD